MTKTVTHIDCPEEWEGKDDYSSHRPMLWLALNNTEGNVAEFGMGHGSTMLIDKFCGKQNRAFNSYETNHEWLGLVYGSYDNWWGNLQGWAGAYSNIELVKHSVLFIDSAPGEERRDLIKINSGICDVIIVHDTEPGAQPIYGTTEALNSFKYRLDYYPKGNPGTTALSNKIDVAQWINHG
jgi:hypothetical protein